MCRIPQLATFQTLRKLPGTTISDVYARSNEPSSDNSTRFYFVGKVAGDDFVDGAVALQVQEVLVKQHARLLLPDVFGNADDREIVLFLAPRDSELRVAQNEIALSPWAPLSRPTSLPSVAACGFEPETRKPNELPFAVRRDAQGRTIGNAFKANIQPPGRLPEFVDLSSLPPQSD